MGEDVFSSPGLDVHDSSLLSMLGFLRLRDRCTWAVAWKRVLQVLKEHPPQSLRLCSVPMQKARCVLDWALPLSSSMLAVDLHGYPGLDVSALVQKLADQRHLSVLSLCHCRALSGEALAYIPPSIRELGLWDAGVLRESDRPEGSEDNVPRGLPRGALADLFGRCAGLEVLDLRGQAAVDDQLARDGLGSLPNLRKVALHGTSITVLGGVALLRRHSESLTRAGFGGLLPGSIGMEVPVLGGAALRELSMGFARNHVQFDFSKMPSLRVLNLDGMRPGYGLHRVLDWHALASTSVQQILLNHSDLPRDIFTILAPLAPQLTHLGLTGSMLADHSSGRARHAQPPANFLSACINLEQVSLSMPSSSECLELARLPRLRMLTLAPLLLEEIQDYERALLQDDVVFPVLEELVLSGAVSRSDDDEDEDDDEPTFADGICNFIGTIPHLVSLVLERIPEYFLLDALRSLQDPGVLRRFSFDTIPADELVTPNLGKELAGVVPSLESLIVPLIVYRSAIHRDECVHHLPKLLVLGPFDIRSEGIPIFDGWVESGRRCIRVYDPYGYDEMCAKPARSFLNLLSFDGLDPIFGPTEP